MAGNVSDVTDNLTIIIDTTIPASPENLKLHPDSDSGISNSDNLTNQTTPTITGTAEAGASIQLFFGDEIIGNATANNAGNWEITTNTLANGVYHLTAKSTDIAGNTSANSTPLVITIDTALPLVNLTTLNEGSLLTPGATLTGTVDGTGSNIANLAYYFDNLTAIPITFNTTGEFNQPIDLTGITNGTHTLTITTTDNAGNIKSNNYSVTVNLDLTAPLITAALVNDTAPAGTNNTDGITSYPTIVGSITETSALASFRAGFNNTPTTNFVELTSFLTADGKFTLNRANLEFIYGAVLPEGTHTLHLQAVDYYGNISDVFNLPFVLDTTVPLSVELDPLFDLPPVGDNQTYADIINLIGHSETGASVTEQSTGNITTVDEQGKFTFANIPLELGDNEFTILVTDAAGNQQTTTLTIKRLAVTTPNSAPTDILLTNNAIAENSPSSTVLATLTTVDPDAENSHTYSLIDNPNELFQIVNNQLQIAPDAVLDYETQNNYSLTIRTTDNGTPHLFFDKTFSINITNVNEAPLFTSTPILNADTNTLYTYNISAQDPEGDSFIIKSDNLPSWLTLIDNGDGTATLSGIADTSQLGIYEISLTAKDTSGAFVTQDFLLSTNVKLQEDNRFNTNRSVELTIPENPSILSFQLDQLNFDTSDIDSINDAIEVSLTDATGKSLVHTISSQKSPFFNLTEGEPVLLGAGATYVSATQTVNLNLIGITPNTVATLTFRLVNNDDDTTSSVRVKNITVLDAPINTQPPVQGILDSETITTNAPNFTNLVDVTPSFQPEYYQTTFNPETHVLQADIAIKNIGQYSINAPLLVVVNHISDPQVQVRNPDGYTPSGLPYYDLTSLIEDGKLDPTGITEKRNLNFYNPTEVQFTYDLEVLSVINTAPVIKSNPVIEIIAGQAYQYNVQATDVEQDELSYKLLVAPEGMTIDPVTGSISWTTSITNKGNHAINVQVSDGRGGLTEQQYNLSVIEAPPNRPPIFTTNPTVDAWINKLYHYDADALDPDGNALSYNLIIGPNGMKVNHNTGEVEWTPPPVLILGDTVLGRVNVPGENDEFNFSGVAGQRIYFDPLQYTGNYWEWNFKVITPSGRQIVSSDLRWHENRLVTLDENGNYRIIVDAIGDRTGNYGFRLIDPSLIPIVPFDTVITDKLSPGTQDRLYRFTATQGQKLFFDQLMKGGSLDWVLYDAKNNVVINNNLDDIELDIPADGEYILAVRGAAGFTEAINYSFNIITPDLITASLTLNNIVSGAISKKGGQHTYTFTGTSGQQLFYDVLDGNAPLVYSLYDPLGTVLINNADTRYDRAFLDGLTLAQNGTYRLVIDGAGENIGNYKFRLLDQTTAIQTTLDTNITGTFGNNGSNAELYKFDLSERQYLYFDGLNPYPWYSGTHSGNWILYGAQGQLIDTAYLWQDKEKWLDAGSYTLVMQGAGAGYNPDYKLRIIGSDLSTEPLAFNSTISGAIALKGGQHTYTFTGNSGQQLFYDALGGDYLRLRVFDPTGYELLNTDSRSDRGFDVAGMTLSMDGTYRLVIDGEGEYTGNYKFRLLDRNLATNIDLDTRIAGTAALDGAGSELYKFTLSSRQYLYFDGLNPAPNWWESQPGAWLLYGANGKYIQSARLWQDGELWLDPGDYLLVAQGYGAGYDPNYQFQIITPTSLTNSLIVGDVISGTITEKGEQDTYTFTGTAGQQLFYDALDDNADLRFTLQDSQGVVLLNSADVRYDRNFFDGLTLPTTGEYRLVIDGPGENTGNYKFSLLDRANAISTDLDTDITGTFSNNGTSAELYKFNLTNRQYLYFDAQNSLGTLQPAAWLLYTGNGQLLQSARLWSDLELWLDAGEYIVAMQGYGTGYDNNYKLRIVTPDVQTQVPISLGTPVSGATSIKGEQDLYTFTGTSGQRLYLDIIDRGNIGYSNRISVLDPSGRELLNRWVWDEDPDAFTLVQTGTYTIRIDGSGEQTDNYSFNVLNLSNAIDITSSIGGVVNSNNQHTYRLTTASSWVDATAQAKALGGNLVTINDAAENQFLINSFGNSESFWIGLSDAEEEGTWKWASGEPVNYTNWAWGQPDNYANEDYAEMRLYWGGQWNDLGASANQRGIIEIDNSSGIAVATDNTGTLDSGRSTKLYQFSGEKGQTLRFTPNELPNGTNWTLYNSSNQVLMNAGVYSAQTVTLTNTGIFTLAIRGYNNAPTNYSFKVSELNSGTPTTPTGTSISLSNVVSGTITTVGNLDYYTFTGVAGQKLFYDGIGGDYLRTHIYDPSGREIVYDGYWWDGGGIDSRNDFGTDRGLTLGMDGTYTITVGRPGATGNYQFRLLDLSNAPTVDLDTDIQGTFDFSASGSSAYRFNINSNSQYLYFDAMLGNGAWIVYGGNGQYINSARLWEDREFLLNQGEYFLVMQGYASDPNYKLRIVNPEKVNHATPIAFDTEVSGTVVKKGENHTYTFTGTAGQKLFYDSLDSDYLITYIYDPSGRLLVDGGIDSRYDRGTESGLTLTMDGTYRLVVDGVNDYTGNYKFRLLDLDNTPIANLDTTIVGQFDTNVGSTAYQFKNETKQYLYFDAQQGDGAWLLYGAAGKSIITSGRLWEDRELSLEPGEYSLVFQGYGSSSDYQLRISTPALTAFPTPINFNTTISDSITEKGEQHYYTFDGTAGQKLFYDAQGGDYFRLSIYDPSGRLIVDDGRWWEGSGIDSRNDRGPDGNLTLSTTGTYRITMDGSGEGTGNYKFSLLDLSNAPTVELDTDITGTFNNGATNSTAYRFKVTDSKQYLYFDAQQGDGAWIVYKDNGAYLTSGRLWEDRELLV